MKLASAETFIVGNPPPGFGGRYFIFVKVTTACGIVGWGECYASSVDPRVMVHVIEDVFTRHMEGEDPANIETMFRRVYSAGFTQRPDLTVIGAFSGLEIACWDIRGKALEQPVHMLLGGRTNERLRAYTYLYPMPHQDPATFYADPDKSAEAAIGWVEQGFTAIKFDPAGPYTILDGHQPAVVDLDRSEAFCARIREAVGNRADLLFGTHGQFTTSGAIRMGRRLEAYDPLWFEEPIPPDNLLEFAKVAQSCRVPIATGERLTTVSEFATILRTGGASILQPALGRVGGIWEARKLSILAQSFNAQIAPHLYAGPIEWAANIQLGAAIPNLLMVETIQTGGDFHKALIGHTLSVEEGHITPPTAPGLGIDVDEALIKENPWEGTRLHLEMQSEPYDYSGENRFAGG